MADDSGVLGVEAFAALDAGVDGRGWASRLLIVYDDGSVNWKFGILAVGCVGPVRATKVEGPPGTEGHTGRENNHGPVRTEKTTGPDGTVKPDVFHVVPLVSTPN
jgi:hypothetical protein